jgi:hypothetical protein
MQVANDLDLGPARNSGSTWQTDAMAAKARENSFGLSANIPIARWYSTSRAGGFGGDLRVGYVLD